MTSTFWGYDASDGSSDVYDYESNDMPPGCLFDNEDIELKASMSFPPTPSSEAFSKQNKGQAGSQEELRRDCRNLTCRPIAARPLPCVTNTTSSWMVASAIFAVVAGTVLIVMVFAVTIFRAECVATAAAVKAWAARSACAEMTRTLSAHAHHVP